MAGPAPIKLTTLVLDEGAFRLGYDAATPLRRASPSLRSGLYRDNDADREFAFVRPHDGFDAVVEHMVECCYGSFDNSGKVYR